MTHEKQRITVNHALKARCLFCNVILKAINQQHLIFDNQGSISFPLIYKQKRITGSG